MKRYHIRINGRTAKASYTYDELKKEGLINKPKGIEIRMENDDNFVDLATYSFDEDTPFYIDKEGNLHTKKVDKQDNSKKRKTPTKEQPPQRLPYNKKEKDEPISSNDLSPIETIVKVIITIACIAFIIYAFLEDQALLGSGSMFLTGMILSKMWNI